MNTTTRLAACAAMGALALSACASRASSVAPMAISASDYAALSCEETIEALALARETERSLTRRQNNAATADAASVFLVLLPLGSVFGADVEGELSQAKGEARALQRAREINCRAVPPSDPMLEQSRALDSED